MILDFDDDLLTTISGDLAPIAKSAETTDNEPTTEATADQNAKAETNPATATPQGNKEAGDA